MLHRIASYLRYRLLAHSKFGVHSPFVYRFIREVLEDDRHYYAFDDIAALRSDLVASNRVIERLDLGALGATGAADDGQFPDPLDADAASKRKQVSVRNLARRSAVGPADGEFLFRLVRHLQPENVLEFGTSLGMSALYMGRARLGMPLVTMEGCPNTAELARENLRLGGLPDAILLTGEFDDRLEEALQLVGRPGLVFIDGNHRADPTLAYFERCYAAAGPHTTFLFDDIRWSDGMLEAWERIVDDPRIRLSIDLGRMGLAFLRPEQREKEHFELHW